MFKKIHSKLLSLATASILGQPPTSDLELYMLRGSVIIDIAGTSLTEDDKKVLAHPLVGGIIYFARNYESVAQITSLSQDIRQHRPDILIAVDQEGGRVQRFKTGFTRLPAMQRFLPLYRKNQQAALSLVEDCGWLMAVELLAVGVDLSFAPVLDVDDNFCQVIADRAFSPKPEEVTELAGAFMRGMQDAGMATTGKHFPGHGSVSGDSHAVSPVDNRTMEKIAQHDLIPFKNLLPSLHAVMPAHIIFPKIDSLPVGFSPYWLQTQLREILCFDGVIFSDDLTMEGAAVAGNYGERAIAAIDAGCDMILVCNNREGVLETLAALDAYPQVNNVEQRNTRIARMQATRKWSVDELQGTHRYTATTTIIGAMTGVTSC
ncbi:MAG: beta-N-acetylhexosaminidase [Candidatus Endobugula sp.]|jgi:beta-N-acetylhexosaminidase